MRPHSVSAPVGVSEEDSLSSSHGKAEEPLGGTTAAPDPRWPHLHRWTSSSPSVKLSPANPSTAKLSPVNPSTANPPPQVTVPWTQARPSVNLPPQGTSGPQDTSPAISPRNSSSPSSPPTVGSSPSLVGSVFPRSTEKSPVNVGALPSPGSSYPIVAESQVHPRGKDSVILSPPVVIPDLPSDFGAPVLPPLRGAWVKKLITSDSLASPELGRGGATSQKTYFPPEPSKEDAIRFPWAAKMDPAARNLYRATSPEYLEDGTPKVMIPSHVMMQGLENQKEYVIGQFYRCSIPPAGLVHAVVNRIWGRKCRIFSRKLSDSSFLFHIPDASTRAWVLQRGLWHVDDCLMFVAPWSTAETFDIPEISTIPVWVTLKNIPHRLYSIPGISHIASGLGAPMATYKPRLDPSLMGEAKILVEVELSKAFPPRIAAVDKLGNTFMVNVEYSWIPTKCGECGQLGHKASRCTNPVLPHVGVTNSCNITTPVIVDSVVIVDTTLDTEVAPIQETESTTRMAECHTIVEAEIVTDSNSNVGSRMVNAEEKDNVSLTEREQSIVLAGNRLSRLGTSFSDGHQTQSDGDSSVSDDSDNEFDLLVPMTPSGQRLLRERPVQPSIKAMEVQASSIARGRGNRGRGHRGRRGRGNGGRG